MYTYKMTTETPTFDPKLEPLLTDDRVALFPIKYADIWDMYQKSKASFWVPEEIDLSTDINDFEQMENDEQHFILMVLAFFANSDWIVNENLDNDFTNQVQVPELKMLWHYAAMMEDIHSHTYQNLIMSLVKDTTKQQQLLQSSLEVTSIKAKADWARKWIKDGTWVQRLLAFSIVEGIFFSASFCAIFWIKKKGLMRGLAASNALISRDEGMHRDTAIMLYQNHVIQKLPKETVIEMIKDAVQVEKVFVDESLPYALIGMNKELMNQYVRFVADHLAKELIGEVIFHADNPFSWMSLLSMEAKTNFFEARVTQYSRAAVSATDSKENTICFDADF